MRVTAAIDRIGDLVWGPPLLILMAVAGLYVTLRTRAVQFRYFFYAHKLALTGFHPDEEVKGDISPFRSLTTALASTIGIGSITGVATALALGGLGAIFWMWVAALFGAATKYAESVLAVKYRITDKRKEMCGGPMHYLERGMGLKFLALCFAFFGAIASLGTGNMVQANSVAVALHDVCAVSPVWIGIVLFVAVTVVLFGGIKSIGRVSAILVPAMALFYILGGMVIIVIKYRSIPDAFAIIFRSAFCGEAACGGFAGATVMRGIELGVSRGVFSGEAGLGTSPMAAAAAKTDTPCRQALISMCTVFMTTGVVCTVTALAIAVSGVFGSCGPERKLLDGSSLALRAFDAVLPGGGWIVTIALVPFAYSTILVWAYYGEKCTEYLFGERWIIPYRILYVFLLVPGAILQSRIVWGVANTMNGLMAFPNLIGILALGSVIANETRDFDKRVRRQRRMYGK